MDLRDFLVGGGGEAFKLNLQHLRRDTEPINKANLKQDRKTEQTKLIILHTNQLSADAAQFIDKDGACLRCGCRSRVRPWTGSF